VLDAQLLARRQAALDDVAAQAAVGGLDQRLRFGDLGFLADCVGGEVWSMMCATTARKGGKARPVKTRLM